MARLEAGPMRQIGIESWFRCLSASSAIIAHFVYWQTREKWLTHRGVAGARDRRVIKINGNVADENAGDGGISTTLV